MRSAIEYTTDRWRRADQQTQNKLRKMKRTSAEKRSYHNKDGAETSRIKSKSARTRIDMYATSKRNGAFPPQYNPNTLVSFSNLPHL